MECFKICKFEVVCCCCRMIHSKMMLHLQITPEPSPTQALRSLEVDVEAVVGKAPRVLLQPPETLLKLNTFLTTEVRRQPSAQCCNAQLRVG